MNDQSTQTIELTLTDGLMDKLKDIFDIEVELLQGEFKILDDGMIYAKFQVAGYKLEMFKDMERMLLQLPTNQVKVKFMGIPIIPN